MGGSTSRSSDVGNENDVIGEDDPREVLSDKLMFLRNAMIQMRGQFLHFQHVSNFWQNEKNLHDNELSLLIVVIKIIHKGVEDLKSGVDVPEHFSKNLDPIIKHVDEAISQLFLELENHKKNKSSLAKLESFINKLNPFDIPNIESLENGNLGEFNESFLNFSLKKQTEIDEKRVERLKRNRTQIQEENEVCFDNSRLINGKFKIQKILRRHVVVFINGLDDEKTMNTLKCLTDENVDFTIYDVSPDAEVRFFAKDFSDCNTFPQIFVAQNFLKLSEIPSVIESLPRVFSE